MGGLGRDVVWQELQWVQMVAKYLQAFSLQLKVRTRNDFISANDACP